MTAATSSGRLVAVVVVVGRRAGGGGAVAVQHGIPAVMMISFSLEYDWLLDGISDAVEPCRRWGMSGRQIIWRSHTGSVDWHDGDRGRIVAHFFGIEWQQPQQQQSKEGEGDGHGRGGGDDRIRQLSFTLLLGQLRRDRNERCQCRRRCRLYDDIG